jgi:hypothetical protein
LFSDVQYLKIFVSPDEPWDALIKQLYSKKIPKKEVKRRIAFLVVSGDKGKAPKDTWLFTCDTFAQYQEGGNWEEEYAAIQAMDRKILQTRESLVLIEYLHPSAVPTDGTTYWAYHYLVEEWGLDKEAAAEEVSVYGCVVIEKFAQVQPSWGKKKQGRYHFVRALHQFAEKQGYDLVAFKKSEERRLFYD